VLRREDGHLADGVLYGALRSSRELRDRGAEFRTGDVQLLGGRVTSTHRVSANRADAVGALCARADVILAATGPAANPSDHLAEALAVLGADIVLDGVAVRPGHPMLLARRPDGIPVIGLPGSPLAAVAGVLTLLEPLIARLTGRALPSLRTAVLADGVPAATDGGSQLVPVAIDDGGIATLLPYAGPAMLRGLAAADALAIAPPGGAESGVRIALLDLPWRDVSPAGGQLP